MTASFHEGERLVQEGAGETAAAAHNGRAIAPRIPAGALSFVAQQPLLVLATRDATGQPWPEGLVGPPGFVTATPTRLTVDLRQVGGLGGAAWLARVDADPAVGTLLIEPATRRRLRVNGPAHRQGDALVVEVREAFPNCPQYVRRRTFAVAPRPRPAAPARERLALSPVQLERVAAADTFFLATAHAQRGPDASHRGGAPGFVRVIAADRLEVPDYAGNSMFTSLGNLVLDPRAGLLLLDPREGCALALAARAELRWEAAAAGDRGATGRTLALTVERWRETDLSFALAGEDLDPWPRNPSVTPRATAVEGAG
jgi:hypothetical protein